MRRAIIIGTGGHCRVVLSILLEVGLHQVLDIIELAKLRHDETILGIPVSGSAENLDSFRGQSTIDVFLAIGNNVLRREWWFKVKELELPLPNLISPHAIVDRFAILGEGNVVCSKAFIGPECKMGNNNLINTGATAEHEVQIGSHCHLCPSSTVAGRSRIHDDCLIGAGATVIDNLTIASGTALGAGAVLTGSIEQSNGVYVGIPARRRAETL
jgi:sugar O-acyltransferase (sialic acid O-acetyltransferase NeuD family)